MCSSDLSFLITVVVRDFLSCQIFQPLIAISMYRIVQTGPNTQLGGLRVIKGTFDVTDLTVARDGVATDATLAQNENVFLRDSAGAPIQVNDGDIIVSLTLTSTTAFTAVSEVDIELLDQTTNGSGVLIPTGTPDVIIDGGTTLTSAPAYLDNIATPVYFSVASPNTFLSVTNVAATSAIAGAFTFTLVIA